MKTSAICLTCFACYLITTSLFAQGQINWANTKSTLSSVNGFPMPVRVSPETTYYFGLFVAPFGTPAPAQGIDGINDPNWQFVAAYAMNSTAAAGAGRMLNPGVAIVNGYYPGTNVSFIVRSWQSTSGGADWSAAKPGLTAIGQSALGSAVLGSYTIPVPAAFGTNSGQVGGFDFRTCLSCCIPWFEVNPSSQSIAAGRDVTLYALPRCYYDSDCCRFSLGYAWRKNGLIINGANSTNLTLTNVQTSDAGTYDMVAHNYYGVVHSLGATLTVLMPAIPATLSAPTYTTNQFQFTVTGTAGSNYVVQVATNLASPTTWLSLFTNASPFTGVDSNAHSHSQRFYRAIAR